MIKKLKQKHTFLNPYIIAEIGVNHEGNLELAQRMIEQAAKSGAHAAKFQYYKAEKIASEQHSKAYWDQNEEAADNQFQLFKRYDSFNIEDYKNLKECCDRNQIDFLCTPFDLEAVELIDPIIEIYKIASADLTNVPLLRKVASMTKPIILSTGAASWEEIDWAVNFLSKESVKELALLHCVLNYPTPYNRAHLSQIQELHVRYGSSALIGYSDHVKPSSPTSLPSLELATLLGATVLEKHFTFDKTKKGNDHYHSMDALDLSHFCQRLATYRELYGSSDKALEEQKEAIENARRRIVASKDLEKGQILDESDLVALRANRGIAVQKWDQVVGKRLKKALKKESLILENDIE